MPRPIRIEFENAWYHVMNRGAGRQNIYKSIEERYIFLDLLEKASKIFGIEVHAYCLMDNHYHLLLKTPRPNLSRSMQYISGNYTKQLNRVEKSDGPIFRSRYKAIIVDKDSYLLEVSRYIHLNPVAANIVKTAVEYRWSSYPYYLQNVNKPDWLHVDEIISMITNTQNPVFYKNFVEAEVDVETNKFYSKPNMPVIFGTKQFKENLLSKLSGKVIKTAVIDYKNLCEIPTIDQVIKKCSLFFGVKEISLYQNHRGKKNIAREIAIYGCRIWAAAKTGVVSNKFQCCPGNVSNIVKRVMQQGRESEKIKVILKELEEIILASN